MDQKSVVMSLRPKWCRLILSGEKTREVRKRAPLLRQPFKVYLYCTKPGAKDTDEFLEIQGGTDGETCPANGYVVGEATCVSIAEYSRPFRESTYGTCLTARELYEYAGANDTLCYMALENPITYKKPRELSEFGLKRAPQSWCYVEDQETTGGKNE